MRNSASSERLHKQFCQTHISTIDRPESGQRSRHGTSGHTTHDIKNRIHIFHHKTSITRQISLFPWTNSWRRQPTKQTTLTNALCRQNYAAKTAKNDNNKPVFHHTHWELLNPQTTTKVSLNFATQFEMPCPANRI